jgi:hypothetical protein
MAVGATYRIARALRFSARETLAHGVLKSGEAASDGDTCGVVTTTGVYMYMGGTVEASRAGYLKNVDGTVVSNPGGKVNTAVSRGLVSGTSSIIRK